MSTESFVAGEYVAVKVSKKAGPTKVSARAETRKVKVLDDEGKSVLVDEEIPGSIRAKNLATGAEFVIDIRTFERKYKKA